MKKQERANRQAFGTQLAAMGIMIQTQANLTLCPNTFFEGLTDAEKALFSKYKTHFHHDGNKLIELGNKVRNAGQ